MKGVFFAVLGSSLLLNFLFFTYGYIQKAKADELTFECRELHEEVESQKQRIIDLEEKMKNRQHLDTAMAR